ncbi:hypothetical protein Clacol_001538 [Clathrus columnatus]|uniref:Uncharacterized protein n=1 Tax=Clathrus columnatus TaxID=1419009 RepID=A0AAV4ZYG9_9AGAM|nr:hypothetical protein Clacol_001538 [Clathrus columnatus]
MTDIDTQFPTTHISSYSEPSATSLQQLVAPNYVSAGSADVILSEVRPTRMKSEALRSLNVLLDELLWLILGHARSFSPIRLKAGLARVLPTVLGKNALLEAEVELRAYVDRNPLGPIEPVDDSLLKKFPLQPAFELLRMKCEAYSSLGDQEENIDLENVLYSRVLRTNKDITIPRNLLTPAGLYLTAILEHICEHILSNVGRVVARDSSRTTAHSSDLYTALCEDESIYPLFKTMKVQDQIEQQSRFVRPRRSESSSHNDTGADLRITSPEPPIPSKSRPSIDSAVSNGSGSNLVNRPSMDRNRTKGFFKSPLADTKFTSDNLRRSNSLVGNKLSDASGAMEDIDESFQDFDVLMRSGNTMKVSLTPDRLKTFEVFSKEKNLRANKPGPQSQPRDTNNPSSTTTTTQSPKISVRSRNEVEAITEVPETDLGRSRSASTSGPSPSDTRPTTPRTRSYTQIQTTPVTFLSHQDNDRISTSKRPTMPTAVTTVDPTNPKRNRRPPARNRESLDLDQIMNGSDDELAVQPKKPLLTPKAAQLTSSGTRDLLEFLSEGPPEPLSSPLALSTNFSDGKNAKSGRLRNIVSRLTGNSTREEPSDSVLRHPVSSSATRPTPLNTKRSIPNVSARAALLQTSYPQDTPISPTHVRDISNSRGRGSEWDRAKEPTEVTPKKQNDFSNIKALPRHSNGEHSYPSTPRKPVPVFDLSKTAVEPPPNKPQSSIHLPPSEIVTNAETTTSLTLTDPVMFSPDESPHLPSEEDINAFRRHVARAGSADECRVLIDMLLSRYHLLPRNEEKEYIIPKVESLAINDKDVETQVVELLLGENDGFSPSYSPPQSLADIVTIDPILEERPMDSPSQIDPSGQAITVS